jgi:uncharacterized RDD family membrane protein YckC
MCDQQHFPGRAMGTTADNLVERDLELTPDLELYTVRTPEMVDFSFQLAGPGSRFLAWLIDTLIVFLILFVVAVLLFFLGILSSLVGGLSAFLFSVAIFLVLKFIVTTFYSVYFEVRWNGQTPGKRALNLRVLGENGTRLNMTQAMIRNLLRALDSMPLFSYVPGLISMAVTEHSQRIGDVLAGTVVIREESRPLPDELKLPQPKYNTLLNDATFVVRCGRVLKPQERELLIEVVQRRDELSLGARSRLFEVLTTHFRERLMLQNEEKFLSDEKWILNLTQVLLESERRTLVT